MQKGRKCSAVLSRAPQKRATELTSHRRAAGGVTSEELCTEARLTIAPAARSAAATTHRQRCEAWAASPARERLLSSMRLLSLTSPNTHDARLHEAAKRNPAAPIARMVRELPGRKKSAPASNERPPMKMRAPVTALSRGLLRSPSASAWRGERARETSQAPPKRKATPAAR